MKAPAEKTLECGCGETKPCKWHDVTDEMRQAFALLLAMNPVQRGRLLCWFCTDCRKEIEPGECNPCAACKELS